MGETTNEITSAGEWENRPAQRASAGVAGGTSVGSTNVDVDPVDTGIDHDPAEAQIRSGIEQTRADLSETIDALQDKLDPSRIAEQVKDKLREKALEAYDTAKDTVKEATIGRAGKIMANVSDTVSDATDRAGEVVRSSSSSFVQFIRQNPVPFALVGIGVGMMAINARRKGQTSSGLARDEYGDGYGSDAYGTSRTGGYSSGERPVTDRARDFATGMAGSARQAAGTVTDTAREAAGRASSAVSTAASNVRDAASNAADATRQQLGQVTDQAKHGAQVASDRFKTTLQENPLALGVAALAAGAIVGLSLPSTRVESEYMGEARDHLLDRAKSAAQETMGKVQHVAQEAGRSVKDAAQKEGLTVDGGSPKGA